ncbi:hypothetical protein [Bacillus cereus]|uniref:Transmembrane protein n=1 Tax=Bacillus cereus TaxID=1396 RepID=A0AAW5L3W7_BACCE|nr:hypothetical protein [Bacillus cereus]MCQ6288941.1 hypothetical protein [Bacillus cereus]MCQ6318343.1 hypothetical protein [Bacillus cereus]MCQ6329991.1 hypothetical protein [Bacillus cereus]MCQ6385949.1 hypothetical protein [Bacillus cereus]
MRRHQKVVGKSGEGMSNWKIQVEHQQRADEVEFESLRFFEGCKNAYLLSLPFWLVISLIWFI